MVTLKEYIARPHIMRGNRFPSAFRIMMDLIKRTGRHAFVLAVQISLNIVAVGYHLRNPDRYLRLTPDHRWNHQHWSHPIFVNESRVSLYRSDCRAHKYQAFHQHDDQLGHELYRLNLDSSANIRWDKKLWLQIGCLCQNLQRRRCWSGVSRGHLSGCLDISIFSCYKTYLNREDKHIASSPWLHSVKPLLCYMI